MFKDNFDFFDDFSKWFDSTPKFKNDFKRVKAFFEIKNEYLSTQIKVLYSIKKDLKNLNVNSFYKLGIAQIPPIRVVFRNFED